MSSVKKINRILVLASCALALTSCGLLPRSGPSEYEIRSADVERGGDVHIIDITEEVANLTARQQSLGFSREFLNAGSISVDRINPGDILSITVWENIENGLFSIIGQKVTVIDAVQVDQLGNIFFPYAGTLRASGRTPNDLREIITEILAGQTPDPQVEVRRIAGEGASISIIGGAGSQGVYTIDAATRRLTGMLARAGGIALDPSHVKISVRRGEHHGEIWLQDLFDEPANDIPLKAGDKIIIEEDERFYVSMGAVGQKRVSFSTHNPSIIEALAAIGGLQSYTSDPTGIFVFRVEPPEVANKVLGRTDIIEPQKFVYVFNLAHQTGIFTGQNFQILDEDTIYVTEAPYVSWNKIISGVIGTLGTVTSLDSAVTDAIAVFE